MAGGACRRNFRRKQTGTAGFFPHSRRQTQYARSQVMHLRTGVGPVKLSVSYGYDPGSGHWGCPMRQRWGLQPRQRFSPALEDRLAFTLTATTSYAQAAALAAKWGVSADDSTLHRLAQRLGARAESQTQARLKSGPVESQPQRAPTDLAVLEIDAWLVRHRGPGWGKQRTQKPRVEWHEMKVGLFYRQEQRAQADNGRGMLTDKKLICWQGDGLELAARLHWQAQAGGLARARHVLALADGADWCWRAIEDRWQQAEQLLDFYHASQHVWEVGRALHGADELKVRPWVEQRLHWLRHGQLRRWLKELAGLKRPPGEAADIVRRNQNYFAEHSGRMDYARAARRGWPIGSGAVESACLTQQGRFKRSGQFWTRDGLRHLSALQEAWTNGHWSQLWN